MKARLLSVAALVSTPLIAALLNLAAIVDAAAATEKCNSVEVRKLTTPTEPTHVGSTIDFENLVIPEAAELVVLGDSIARQLYLDGGLASAAGFATSVSLAGPGDGLQHSLFKLGKLERELAQLTPKAVFMAIGTNNTWSPPCALEAGFLNHLSLVRRIWPSSRIYVMSVMPRGPFFQLNDPTRSAFNSYLEDQQTAFGYTLVLLPDDAITCGLSTGGKIAAVESLLKSSSESGVECQGAAVDAIELNLAGNEGVSFQCSYDANCKYFRSDNVHLTDSGIRYVVKIVAEALGRASLAE